MIYVILSVISAISGLVAGYATADLFFGGDSDE